jgi:hypothetical protein
MGATIHPGRPNLLMDHLQLGLRRPDADVHDQPLVYISLYVVAWSRELGAGHVALVRHRPPHVTEQTPSDHDGFDQILTDNPDLGRRLRDQLRSVGYSRVDLSGEPRPASFIRGRLADQDHLRYLISSIGLEIDTHWNGLGEPTLAYGPAPQQPETQQIWSVLFEAESASVTVNGATVDGRIYPMEHWVPWLGRPLASAHIARSEILVDLPESAA